MIYRIQLRQEIYEIRRIIAEHTGYTVKSTLLLNQIFRRSSLAAETGHQSNEIFEFIGDRILSQYVIKILANKFGAHNLVGDYVFKIHENRFAQIQQELVKNDALAKIIDDWDIAKYLLLSRSDIKNDVIKEVKVKADLFEAILGAIAIESNWNQEILEKAVYLSLNLESKFETMLQVDPRARIFDIDTAITKLKEIAEQGQCTMPEYDFAGPDILGYDENSNPKWDCTCTIINDITGIRKAVVASSKKDAKKAASYLVLCEHFSAPNKYGPNDWYMLWTYKDGKLFPNRPCSTEKADTPK